METARNDKSSIEARVEDLLSRMTLEQKMTQLQCMMVRGNPDESLAYFPEGVGQLTQMGGSKSMEANVAFAKEAQDIVTKSNSFGIPALLHCEAVTGVNVTGATTFPSAIGLGATWNPETVEEMSEIIRDQMLAIGVRQALSPVMDIARDPRWGRVGETYGEDPTLSAAMSVAFTRGLQGDELQEGVVATAKHFLGYGFGEGGLNMASNPIPPRELREVYAKPFQAAITEAGLESVMNSYGAIDGELIIKSKRILNDLLRDEMGFEGIVVGDYMSINRIVDLKLAPDPAVGGIEAIKAGLDVELPYPYGYSRGLLAAVKEGLLDESFIDRAVRRVLQTKFKLGLFENPYPREELLEEAYGSERTIDHNLKAARESIVLLKNEGILPLDKNIKKIAVIGPHANSLRLLFGCYTYPATLEMGLNGESNQMAGIIAGEANSESFDAEKCYEGSRIYRELPLVTETINQLYGDKTPTILASIKAKCPHAHVVYVQGCDIAGTNRDGFEAAVNAAKDADVVILTLGGKYGWGRSCTTGEGIDSTDIGLNGVQEELAKVIFETDTPAVVVHMDAKPLSSEFITERYPAIIENWFPGDTGGAALADVLFGDYNPAGRLPITAARNAGQIPIYAMHRKGDSYIPIKGMVLSRYIQGPKKPLFYFGDGKSYTTFEYSDLQMDKAVQSDGTLNLSCKITNTGTMDGDEVIQLYVTDEISSMLRPNMELAGFKRLSVKAGQTKTVHFAIKADQFAFLDADMKWIVEAGEMTVRVGASSNDIRLSDTFEIKDTAYIDAKKRGFYANAKVT
ncbi:glycoside hydrolase family 3 N-terminal domain-containing protein [Paenibacillus prosopidis]|uniref:Beta-glucosidase n=1 Tax=Paenibacillus prosopidis TaxID=630520 RepID=A0A368VP46_9BACL|nr:glycoside hydrolase family 3 N-terminal domain-containing protein [Paenibacillus prosopidis]RCW43499.1 beta-glucosidase [Paenibacillus prosopidis]